MDLEAMRNQTFGVEVEMNSITRMKAARVAARFFGTNNYKDTDAEDGYRCWSAWDTEGRKWKFEYDSSIEGRESEKCELVTPILTYKDMELLQNLVRELRKEGAKSDHSRGCGIHVHIGLGDHTPTSLRNLVNLMARREQLFVEALKIAPSRTSSYCKPVDPFFLRKLNEEKPRTMSKLADLWYNTHGCSGNRFTHYNYSRYHMLNLHAVFTKGTIEFRLFQFNTPDDGNHAGIHAGRLKAYIQMALALSQYAKEMRCAFPNARPIANKKEFMRRWLSTIGLVGDEFKTMRDVFSEGLDENRVAA